MGTVTDLLREAHGLLRHTECIDNDATRCPACSLESRIDSYLASPPAAQPVAFMWPSRSSAIPLATWGGPIPPEVIKLYALPPDAQALIAAAEESLATQVKITAEVLERERKMQEVLVEARKKIQIPSRFIRVRDGEPFEPGPLGIMDVWGGEPKVGESAGYQDVSYPAGNWSGKAIWRVQHMKWADNPEYAQVMALLERVDAALSGAQGKEQG